MGAERVERRLAAILAADVAGDSRLMGEDEEGTLRAIKETIAGKPDMAHVRTSYIERANLTMRMSMRRFTRLTNGFTKKLQNHEHMVALYVLWYNFVRIHKTLRTSPAMAAGGETRLWSMEDVVRLIDEHAERTVPRLANRLVG